MPCSSISLRSFQFQTIELRLPPYSFVLLSISVFLVDIPIKAKQSPCVAMYRCRLDAVELLFQDSKIVQGFQIIVNELKADQELYVYFRPTKQSFWFNRITISLKPLDSFQSNPAQCPVSCKVVDYHLVWVGLCFNKDISGPSGFYLGLYDDLLGHQKSFLDLIRPCQTFLRLELICSTSCQLLPQFMRFVIETGILWVT